MTMRAFGLNELIFDLTEAAATIGPRASQVVRKTAHDVESSMKANIQDQGLVDTGFMLNSVGISPPEVFLHAEVGPTAHYAGYHEHGTSTIPARPFAGPAARHHEEAFYTAMEQVAADVF